MDSNMPASQGENNATQAGVPSSVPPVNPNPQPDLVATPPPQPAAPVVNEINTTDQPPAPSSPPIPQVPPEPVKKSSPVFIIALVLLLIAIIALGGYVLWTKYLNKSDTKTTPIAVTTPSPTPDPTANWETYINKMHNFNFKYPSIWVIDTTESDLNENAEVRLTNNEAIIQIFANVTGVRGGATDCKGVAVIVGGTTLYKCKQFDATTNLTTISLSDSSTLNPGVFQFKDKVYYDIHLTYSGVDQTQQGADLEKDFDQILSTFKLVEATPAASSASSPSATVKP